jgi:type IV pilus assembly protein PilX
MPYCRDGLRTSQRGATLIVGLVLLLVLTVVGVSGMNTATMQITMAANTQFQQDAFQMTEDAIDIAIATQNLPTDPLTPVTIDWIGDPSYDRRALVTYQWATPVPGGLFSAGNVGSGGATFSAWHYDVQSVGRGPRNATSQHVQSFYFLGQTPP